MKVTTSQIRKAIIKDNKFIDSYPEKNVVYFLGDASRKERILMNLSSTLFYDECRKFNAYGSNEILNVLLQKLIPVDVVEFFVKFGDGGSDELDAIALTYEIGETTLNSLEEFYKELIIDLLVTFSISAKSKTELDELLEESIEYEVASFNASYEEIKKIFENIIDVDALDF